MKGAINRYCSCRDPNTGKQLAGRCPELRRNGKHGEWDYRARLMTSTGQRTFRRRGFATKLAATALRRQVHELIELAHGDDTDARRIADLIFDKSKNGGQLPATSDVRRRLGLGRDLGRDLDRSETLAEWLERWFARKRAIRESTARGYRQHLDQYLIPHLGHFPVDRLAPEHITDLFDLIEEWNTEITKARKKKRRPILEGDVRTRARHVGVASQRRIYATLRNALNSAMKGNRRLIDYNPCDAVEMPSEHRDPARVWSPQQVAAFLTTSADDRLALLYRLVLLRGLRRGEAVGLRWEDIDLDKRDMRITRPILQLGGRITTSQPKTRAGERLVSIDKESAQLLRAHRTAQKRERLAFGTAYQDHDLVFCREDGTPVPPDKVTQRFRQLAKSAGLPEIRLHEGRHTAATVALEAEIDIKIVADQLGHSTTRITHDLYTHVRRSVHGRAAEAVVKLLNEHSSALENAGS
ncbi:MAG: tyrosine-type recombinase/integrase [Micromonosporaceae bacterium]